MDIWGWVYELQEALSDAGHGRLVDLIDSFPRYVLDLEHEQVEALYPEALLLAREAQSPWLEVFFRHWYLQSKVFMRHEVSEALPLAVSLIEFSHREATRECPQSVCATQDLAGCYGRIDGPGYVPERLAAAQEALARIDPSWPCFGCISEEYAEALLDDGQYEAALAFIETQARALEHDAGDNPLRFRGPWVEALVRLGRLQEAYDLNERAEYERYGKDFEELRRIDRARILALQGEDTRAMPVLPPFDQIAATAGHYLLWAEAAQRLALGGALPNDAELAAWFQHIVDRLVRQGVRHDALTITLWQAELALARGDHAAAQTACDHADAVAGTLRKPQPARAAIARQRERIAVPPTDAGK